MNFDASTLAGRVTIADGSWSTQLQARGFPLTVPAESANLSRPDLVLGLARDYLAAGARILTTNTFGANRVMLARRNLAEQTSELNRRGAELAREAVGRVDVSVAGSIAPSGVILAVREKTAEEIAPVFAEQARALAAGGVDVILLETFSELEEILLAVRTVKQATGLPVIASMSFDSGPQRTRTMMGAAADRCAEALDEAGADVIGTNCGAGIATALPVVVALRAATARPLWVKPNAGVPELVEGRAVYRQTPDEFASFAPKLLEAGANIIGGCCGTGPEHIRRLAALVGSRSRGSRKRS